MLDEARRRATPSDRVVRVSTIFGGRCGLKMVQVLGIARQTESDSKAAFDANHGPASDARADRLVTMDAMHSTPSRAVPMFRRQAGRE